mmetsp:Transcript_25734/g.59500  ORF Transcript_25734/g.59500 Transcript_25734/m.59500 type:complete len:716 (-) Transcript_25734:109-2256(-)
MSGVTLSSDDDDDTEASEDRRRGSSGPLTGSEKDGNAAKGSGHDLRSRSLSPRAGSKKSKSKGSLFLQRFATERGRDPPSSDFEDYRNAGYRSDQASLAEEKNYMISRVIETCVQVAIATDYRQSPDTGGYPDFEALHPILPLVPVYLPSGPKTEGRVLLGYLQIRNFHAALMRKLWEGPFADSCQSLAEEFSPGSVKPHFPKGSNSGARFFESKTGIFITKNLGEKPLIDGEKEFLIERGVLEAYSAHLSETEVDEYGEDIMVQDVEGRWRPKYKETILPEYLLIFEVKLIDDHPSYAKTEAIAELPLRNVDSWRALRIVLRRNGWENRGERMLVMTSVFAEWRRDLCESSNFTLQRPLKVWDLKGNIDRGRGDPSETEVHRDAQLVKSREYFYLESEDLSRLSRALKRDTEWLYNECLCDYSLLVGYFEVAPTTGIEPVSENDEPMQDRQPSMPFCRSPSMNSLATEMWRSSFPGEKSPQRGSRSQAQAGNLRGFFQTTSKTKWPRLSGSPSPADATPLLDESEAESWRSARLKHHLRRASVTARTLLRRMSFIRTNERDSSHSASSMRGHGLACVYVKGQPGLMSRAKFHARTAKAMVRGRTLPSEEPPQVRSGKLLIGIIDILEMWGTARCMHYTCLWRCCCFCPATDVIRPDRYRVRFEDFFFGRFRDFAHFPLLHNPVSPPGSSSFYSFREQELQYASSSDSAAPIASD